MIKVLSLLVKYGNHMWKQLNFYTLSHISSWYPIYQIVQFDIWDIGLSEDHSNVGIFSTILQIKAIYSKIIAETQRNIELCSVRYNLGVTKCKKQLFQFFILWIS